MLLKQLLLLLYAVISVCADFELDPPPVLLYPGKLQQRNTTLTLLNSPQEPPVWRTLVGIHSDSYVFYGTRDENNPTIYRITHLGKENEALTEVVRYSRDILRMLRTNIADLPLFVLSKKCMAWLDPSIPQVYRWTGTGCANISENAINHTNHLPDRLGNINEYHEAAITTNYVYVYSRQNRTVIHVMAVSGVATYKRTLEEHVSGYITMLEYGGNYLYIYTSQDELLRVNASLLNTPSASNTSQIVGTGELFMATANAFPVPGYPVGHFSRARLPKITQMHYFKDYHMFIFGTYQYTQPGNSSPTSVSVIRLLNLKAFFVFYVRVDPDGWDIYTRLNPESSHAKRLPLITQSYLLSYNETYLNFYIYSTLPTQTGPRAVPHNWQFYYSRTYSSSPPPPPPPLPTPPLPTPPTAPPTIPPTTPPTPSPTTSPTTLPTTPPTTSPTTPPTTLPTTPPTTPPSTTADNAADTRSAWSGVIYVALVNTLLLAAEDGSF